MIIIHSVKKDETILFSPAWIERIHWEKMKCSAAMRGNLGDLQNSTFLAGSFSAGLFRSLIM